MVQVGGEDVCPGALLVFGVGSGGFDYGDFVAGNVVEEPITAMLARAGGLRYVAEFATAVNDCADRCGFYDFCRGGQAGNRYFEHGTFTVRETGFCRTTRQALVRATAD